MRKLEVSTCYELIATLRPVPSPASVASEAKPELLEYAGETERPSRLARGLLGPL